MKYGRKHKLAALTGGFLLASLMLMALEYSFRKGLLNEDTVYRVRHLIGKVQSQRKLRDYKADALLKATLVKSPYANHPFPNVTRASRDEFYLRISGGTETLLSKELPEEVIYNVTYTYDHWQRRVVPQIPKKPIAGTIVMMGCSFTFGEGVEDHETLPNQLAQRLTNYEVINYGSPGYGVNHFLDEFKRGSVRSEIQRPKIPLVIFTMIYDHMDRMLCSLSYCTGKRARHAKATKYIVNENGKVLAMGPFNSHFPWNLPFLGFISNSQMLRKLNFFSFRRNLKDTELSADIVNELAKQVRSKWGAERFIVVLYPDDGNEWSQDLKGALEKRGIEVLDYSNIDLRSVMNGRATFPVDGHPTPGAHYLMGWLLEKDIKAHHWLKSP